MPPNARVALRILMRLFPFDASRVRALPESEWISQTVLRHERRFTKDGTTDERGWT